MEIRSDLVVRPAIPPAAAPVPAAPDPLPRDRTEIGAAPGIRPAATVAAAAPADVVSRLDDDFSIREGHQVNYFTSCGDASAHTIVTDATKPRILVTYPDMNCGTGLWLKPGVNLRLTAPPRSIRTEHGQGVTAEAVADGPRMEITNLVLDSVRAIRDEKVPGASDDIRKLREDAAAEVGAPAGWAREQVRVRDGHVLEMERTALNGHPFRLQLDFPAGTRIDVTGPQQVEVASADGKPLRFALRSEIPYHGLHRYPPEKLLRPATLDELRSLDEKSRTPGVDALTVEDRNHFFEALRGLEFLSRHEKFMAGAWRFMTYFGRDTMISLMLLQDAVTPRAYCDGIQSVLDRLAPNGDVAHEEDIGPWAEIDHLRAAQKNPGLLHGASAGALDAPVYDYKMVDDDLLLPIMAARYLADPSQSADERRAFLMRKGPSGQTNLQRLVTNWNFNLAHLERYARTLDASRPNGDFHELVRIHEGQRVGNWRDSEVGLAGGVYPEDVNVDLALGAVRAMNDVLKTGLVKPSDLGTPLPSLNRLEGAWERAHACFDERMSPDQIRARLGSFLNRSHPSAAETQYFNAIRFSDGSTLQQFLAGGPAPPELRGGLQYTALSLDKSGHPVAIPNTDFGFRLFLGKPAPGEIDDMLKWLELPYPVGLMTPVGPVVANAAYSHNPQHWKILDNDAYHGAVIWSWQMSMLEMGLLDQVERFRGDASQSALVQRMQQAVTRLEEARRAAGPLANSELWTWDIHDGRMVGEAFGQRASSETESNAVQLWSTVYPALYLKRQEMSHSR